MRTKYIDVDGFWGVVLCYDLDWDDERKVRAYLRSFGLKEDRIDYCVDTVLGRKNCACCVSDRMLCLYSTIFRWGVRMQHIL